MVRPQALEPEHGTGRVSARAGGARPGRRGSLLLPSPAEPRAIPGGCSGEAGPGRARSAETTHPPQRRLGWRRSLRPSSARSAGLVGSGRGAGSGRAGKARRARLRRGDLDAAAPRGPLAPDTMALAEVVVCAVGRVVTLPAVEITAQATALLVLVMLSAAEHNGWESPLFSGARGQPAGRNR
ncbi:uncharacterized protein LOC115072544 [Nannospalax galili]|uniref:uncharacterized protein LOC115072544 n=1 Tax=Nannospalax galili TaxID=1026970 RepID=UPI00111C26D9|nr:uncharacterized protein LOC115072544 [Nannospalax galili]